MIKSLCVLALSLSALLTPAHAAPMDARTKSAIDELVASQNLVKLWPQMLDASAQSGADQIKRGAREAAGKNTALTAQQRDKAFEIIEKNSTPMAAEIAAYHRALPISALVSEMAYKVYPKYFSTDEIESLARFYTSSTFQKMTRFHLRLSEERARTGQSESELQKRLSMGLTPQEERQLVEFSNSPAGRKQQKEGAAFAAEMRTFMDQKTAPGFDAIVTKYGKIMQAEMQKAFPR
jgi:hypothetical protein